MKPAVKIGADIWRKIKEELSRVYPLEGLAVPMVALRPWVPNRNPTAPIQLDDLREVVVADAVLVPHSRQINRSARVSVLEHTDAPVNAEIESLVGVSPRLRASAYLHSHPFAVGQTWPSRGPRCDYEGHMLPLLARNRRAGLHTSFSFIACRSAKGSDWVLHCFALRANEAIVDLGLAEVVDSTSHTMRWAQAPSLTARSVVRHI